MLTLDQFDYDLPKKYIAHTPVKPRDASKLMVVNRTNQSIAHHTFSDLPQILDSSYVIVRNDTKVFPARLFGTKTTGGKVELLLHKKISETSDTTTWECLTKPGLKPNQEVKFQHTQISARCVSTDVHLLTRNLTFSATNNELLSYLEKYGQTPTPPYIENNNSNHSIKQQYQTTYAQQTGSVAAPTAGLHFTDVIDKKLEDQGINIFPLTLHVGMGTFLPVSTQKITDHHMHAEFFSLSKITADALNTAKKNHKKILTIGTTTTRTIEHCATKKCEGEEYLLQPQNGETEIFIYPGYEYKYVDAMLTNFHLPKSTLLMMISAFVTSPTTPGQPFTTFSKTLVGRAYEEAKNNNYRFYSFGDAMLIL